MPNNDVIEYIALIVVLIGFLTVGVGGILREFNLAPDWVIKTVLLSGIGMVYLSMAGHLVGLY